MKKILANLALVAAMVLGFASCTKVECDCPKENTSTQWQINNYVIKANNWEFCASTDGTNGFFRAKLNAPELSKFIWEEGAILGYLVNSDGGQQALPCTRHYEEYNEEGLQITWTETTEIEFLKGECYVYVTYSDFFYPEGATPGDMSIRLVMLW